MEQLLLPTFEEVSPSVEDWIRQMQQILNPHLASPEVQIRLVKKIEEFNRELTRPLVDREISLLNGDLEWN